MSVHASTTPPADPGAAGRPLPGTTGRIAKLLTDVLSPAVLIVLVVVPAAVHGAKTPTQAWISAAVAALTGSLIPIAYIIQGVRAGRWTDHHVRVRDQRRLPLTVTLISGTIGCVLLALTGAREMVAMCVAGISALAVAMVITFVARWKVSIHAIVAAGSAAVLTLIFGWLMVLTWPVAAAIGWSRVRLRDHTAGQVLVGLIIGAVAGAVVFPLLR